MTIRLTLFVLIAITTLTGQTMVNGSVSGIWEALSGPYQLSGNAYVPAGDTLIVDDNTVVDLGTTYELRIRGTLIATHAIFNNGGRLFSESGEVHVSDCQFLDLNGGLQLYGGRASIDNCLFDHTHDTGITFSSADSSYVRQSLILNSGGYGIKISQSDLVEITGNTLAGNSIDDYNHPALFIDSCSPQHIEGNTIEDNHAQGIGVWTLTAVAAPVIRNNLVRRNYTGITIVNAPPLIENNIIVANYQVGNYNSGAGIYAGYPSSRGIVMGNYIAGNYFGISNINNAALNMGDMINDYFGDDGLNLFYDNSFNGETWNIWNGTNTQLLAQNNYWIALDFNAVDATLYDNEEGGGEILFEPIYAAPLPIPPDLNADSNLNILDVVMLVENLIQPGVPEPVTFYLSDIDHDYYINIQDIVTLIQLITEG